jgi:pimeloyl-ACP methyl ester carboxylesterase
MTEDWLIDGPGDAPATVVLAHGAGAMMDTPFMDAMASGLAAAGLRVVRFEFPYMAKRRADGKRRGPDRKPALLETWREIVTALGPEIGPAGRLIVGGKSMGGRIASELAASEAAELGISGVACLGYPFHPAGMPENCAPNICGCFPSLCWSFRASAMRSARGPKSRATVWIIPSSSSGCPTATTRSGRAGSRATPKKKTWRRRSPRWRPLPKRSRERDHPLARLAARRGGKIPPILMIYWQERTTAWTRRN